MDAKAAKAIQTIKIEGTNLSIGYEDRGPKKIFFSPEEVKGRGAYSKTLVKRKFALKIIGEKDRSSKVDKESFEREVDVLRNVQNLPNFIKCHASGETEDQGVIDFLGCSPCKKVYFILMECAENTLDKWIETLNTEEDVRLLFRQICDRVLRMNGIGFTHRDIKVKNIMYDVIERKVNEGDDDDFNPGGGKKVIKERVVKLISFWLARKGSSFPGAMGTLVYIAPEVYGLRGAPSPVDCPLADIWSLGIVLLEILAKMKNVDLARLIPAEFYNKAYNINKIMASIPELQSNVGRFVSEAEFPNCLRLLKRLLVKEDERITVDELKKDPWLKLNVDDIVCGYFKIESSTLGAGGCGSVRKGTNIYTGQKVSIKRMSNLQDKSIKDFEKVQELFEKYSQAEIDNLMKVREFPNVLQVLGYSGKEEEIQYEVPETVYYAVTELCDGYLSKCNPGGKIPKECIRQLCNALAYMNAEKGMVHRDIKPENIMYIDRNGKKVVKIIDFGTAKKMDIAVSTCGTYGYRAPELYRLETASKADKADIFSLGITFCEYDNEGLLPDDFPREVIEKMTKPKYEERMSWDEFKRVEYFGFNGELFRNVEQFFKYADSKYFEYTTGNFSGPAFTSYDLYGLYYAMYRKCCSEPLLYSYMSRCEVKLHSIAEPYESLMKRVFETTQDEILLREVLNGAKEWSSTTNPEKKKAIEERVAMLLYKGFYLDPEGAVYKDIKADLKETMKLKIDE